MKPFIIENVIAADTTIDLIAVDGRVLSIQLEGDCCSSSFFDDYSKVDARGLFGHRLMSMESVGRKAPEVDTIARRGDDSTAYHALIIRTDKESVTIDWRNESNGYYDGWANVFIDGVKVSESWNPVLFGEAAP